METWTILNTILSLICAVLLGGGFLILIAKLNGGSLGEEQYDFEINDKDK